MDCYPVIKRSSYLRTSLLILFLLSFLTACHEGLPTSQFALTAVPSTSEMQPFDSVERRLQWQEQACLTDPAEGYDERHELGVGGFFILNLGEGGGLVLCEDGGFVLELSPWNLTADDFQTYQADSMMVISYRTLEERKFFVHLIVLNLAADPPVILWQSDEDPEFLFIAQGGELQLAEDLTAFSLTGLAEGATGVFDEKESVVSREFQNTWFKEEGGIEAQKSLSHYGSVSEYADALAIASPYATLIRFLEWLVVGNEAALVPLVTEISVISTARDYGLHYRGRVYRVIEASRQRIVFKDEGGEFVAEFTLMDGVYLLADIYPRGARGVTSP